MEAQPTETGMRPREDWTKPKGIADQIRLRKFLPQALLRGFRNGWLKNVHAACRSRYLERTRAASPHTRHILQVRTCVVDRKHQATVVTWRIFACKEWRLTVVTACLD